MARLHTHWKYAWSENPDKMCPIRPIRLPPPVPLIPVAQRPLSQQDWFHGPLTRQETQTLLSGEGDFLLRESQGQPGRYVLSVMNQGQCKHFIIQCLKGRYHFEPTGPSFLSIPQLIHHHLKTHQGLTERSPALLRNPVVRVKWNLSHNDVILGELLGSGNFGEVYSGRLSYDNTPVAVKTCREHLAPETKEKFLMEARILRQYRHPNIVRILGICAQKQPILIVMELVSGGDFLSFLQLEGSRLWVRDLVRFAIQAAAGMAYLESHCCIHRDLAARNCLVGEGSTLKISDFGMSRQEENGIYSSKEGLKHIPIKWTAPEALKYGRYSTESDVWSYGILLWEIFSLGSTPYHRMSNQQVIGQVERGFRMRAPKRCPMDIYDLMLRCWDRNPRGRPTFSAVYKELLQFHWDSDV
ncbi:tyrosine-protein kinase Fer-like [Sphaerodactylus townsendi]|uniref:tyrosine-protein kinase Fer-like n=1 Tax=Sphaerodactylus townsendi TaxID=933632 RepID=UPI0020265023|nr:tyrosine-protein kinase Fer-like [Sphaerodactylus townsendi]